MKNTMHGSFGLTVLGIAMLAFSLPAFAQETVKPVPDAPKDMLKLMFDIFDLNKDGLIGDYEYTMGMRDMFATMDKDRDGKVSLEDAKVAEFTSSFNRIDTEKSGTLTEFDFITQIRKEFNIVDLNQDGFVNFDEFKNYEAKIMRK